MNKFIFSIENQQITQTKFSGGKGSNLARLKEQGFNVPPFFIISSSLYQHIIKINEIDQFIQKAVLEKSVASFNKIQSAILRAEIPEFIIAQIKDSFKNLIQNSGYKAVAVRSSALAEDLQDRSFAGQLESYLDIRDEKQLLEGIKKCWASLWNERVFNYISKIQTEFAPQPIAVIVQQKIPSEFSGVCFTLDPTDAAQQWMMIEAHQGIGAELVAGKTNPFRYRAHRKSLEIKADSTQSVSPLISIDKITELAQTCLKIEKYFGAPQDIEWAFYQNEFYILQSRPITATARKSATLATKLWSNYFFGERFPQPVSPLGWSILKPMIENNAFREPLKFLGFNELARSRITKCFYGRPYTRLEVFQALHSLFPTAYVSADKRQLFYDQPVSLRQSLIKVFKNIFAILKSLISTTDWIPPIHLRNWQRFLNYYCAKIQSLNKLEQQILSDEQLWQLNFQAERLSDRLLQLHRWSITFAELIFHFLIFLIRNWLPRMEADQIVVALHRSIPGNKTVEMNIELWKLSCQLKDNRSLSPGGGWDLLLIATPDWKSFIKKFGHRSTTLDIAAPTFEEDVDYIRNFIQPYLSVTPELSPDITRINFEQQRLHQRQAVFENLSKQPWGFLKRQFLKMLLNWSEQFFLLRENQRHYWHQALAINRRLFLEFGKRWFGDNWLEKSEHVFFLTRKEVEQALSQQKFVSKSEIEKRIIQQQQWQGIQPPAIIDESIPAQLDAKVFDKKLVGIGASPGVVTGQARVLTALQQMAQIQPGEILVVPTTDPGWTPLFGIIKGLVMEVGGVLSHGSIVAREFGIPAVTSVVQATAIIKTGTRVTVDGTEGMVWINDD